VSFGAYNQLLPKFQSRQSTTTAMKILN